MIPVYLCALLAQRHARRLGQHVPSLSVPGVLRSESTPSRLIRAVLALGLLAALVSCERAAAPRAGGSPSSEPAAAPDLAWCLACRDLPNLGREPRVRRAGR